MITELQTQNAKVPLSTSPERGLDLSLKQFKYFQPLSTCPERGLELSLKQFKYFQPLSTCTTPLLQKITVVDRHVAIASRHLLLLLLSQDLNLLDNWESL